MRLMLSVLVALAWPAAAVGADPPPLRLAHVQDVNGIAIRVPMELYLSAATETRLDVKLAGNLRAFQANLPALLSQVVEDSCDRRIGFEVTRGTAEGDRIRLQGRVQAILYRCRNADRATRRRLLSNITEIDLLLDARLKDDCLFAELVSLDLDPGGLTGFTMNILGLTERIGTRVQQTVNATLADADSCLDMPDALKVLDARLVSGGFRDFGGGEMGFVLKGAITVSARNTLALLDLIDAQALLDADRSGRCRCP